MNYSYQAPTLLVVRNNSSTGLDHLRINDAAYVSRAASPPKRPLKPRRRKRVCFSIVEFRIYNVTVLPCASGSNRLALLTLDGPYVNGLVETVDSYEEMRHGFRRTKHEGLLMNLSERRRRLMEDFGFSPEQLQEKRGTKIRHVRRKSPPLLQLF